MLLQPSWSCKFNGRFRSASMCQNRPCVNCTAIRADECKLDLLKQYASEASRSFTVQRCWHSPPLVTLQASKVKLLDSCCSSRDREGNTVLPRRRMPSGLSRPQGNCSGHLGCNQRFRCGVRGEARRLVAEVCQFWFKSFTGTACAELAFLMDTNPRLPALHGQTRNR